VEAHKFKVTMAADLVGALAQRTIEADHKTPTGLGGYLNQRGIDKAFVTGLATDFCVAWTAIDARNVGFEFGDQYFQ
jgi:nicotinamidase-related amidase